MDNKKLAAWKLIPGSATCVLRFMGRPGSATLFISWKILWEILNLSEEYSIEMQHIHILLFHSQIVNKLPAWPFIRKLLKSATRDDLPRWVWELGEIIWGANNAYIMLFPDFQNEIFLKRKPLSKVHQLVRERMLEYVIQLPSTFCLQQCEHLHVSKILFPAEGGGGKPNVGKYRPICRDSS